MVRQVTIYNYTLTENRKRHYDNVMKELDESDFERTFYRINHGDDTVSFWSYSMNEWRGLNEALNKPY